MKEYIKPTTIQVAIRIQQHLLQGSVKGVSGLDDDDIENGGNDPGEFSRRRRSVWDYDDDEE